MYLDYQRTKTKQDDDEFYSDSSTGSMHKMAGHSKWAQIKRQKGVTDQKRGATFGKLANAITVAAKQGADPEMNFLLRIAIDKAKSANMPKDNIERAIERASGTASSSLDEETFEAYGPNGIAFLVEVATDNRNRTIGEIRAVLNKLGGKMAESGSVSYLFERVGRLVVTGSGNEEAIELSAIDAGAKDVGVVENSVFITTEPHELDLVRKKMSDHGFDIEEFSLAWEPKSQVIVDQSNEAERLIKLSVALEELDDVVRVASNFEVPEGLLE